jgi:hypothetical protein
VSPNFGASFFLLCLFEGGHQYCRLKAGLVGLTGGQIRRLNGVLIANSKYSGGIEMKRKIFQIALLVTSLLALASVASAQRINRAERRELRADRHEIRADNQEIRSGRRDISQDVNERNADVRELRQDRREGASLEELRADRREINADTREIRSDRRDLRLDVRDRRGDVRDFRQDRRRAIRN